MWGFIALLLNIALTIATFKKPENAQKVNKENFQLPTADQRKIPHLCGTRENKGPNVTWWGDLKQKAIKGGSREYGLFGPKQTIGYQMFLGQHLGFCYGPADKLIEIRVADKIAWQGSSAGGRITIDQPNLFGGKKKDGGISGDIDVEMGASDQDQNDYLAAKISTDVPAFRGVVHMVLRQVYVGTGGGASFVAKPWSATFQRIFARPDGTAQWYQEKAGIISAAFRLRWYQAGKADEGRMGLQFLDASDATMGDVLWADYQTTGDLDNFVLRTLQSAPPANAVKVRIYMEMQRNGASGNNANFDDIAIAYNGGYLFITNPGAEDGTTGWTNEEGALAVTSDYHHLGTHCFYGGSHALTRAHQDVPLSPVLPFSTYFPGLAIYFAVDSSLSMDDVASNGQTRLTNLKAALSDLFDYMKDQFPSVDIDIYIAAYSSTISAAIETDSIDSAGYDALKTFVNGLTTSFGTDFHMGVSSAASFFEGAGSKTRMMLFLTDGEPVPTTSAADAAAALAGIDNLAVWCFNIDEPDTTYTALLDNTASDGVPVIDGGDPSALKDAMAFALGADASVEPVDMNPVHIIREWLQDKIVGRGHPDSDFGTTWEGAADTLYSESFGISPLYDDDQDTPVDDLISDLENYINGSVYLDPRTGKYEIKLVRDDYVLDDLLIVTDADIISVGQFSRKQPADTTNSVNVKYYDRDSRKPGALTVFNDAGIQQANGVNPTDRAYDAITSAVLADRVGQRDLRTMAANLVSGQITVVRKFGSLNLGSAFRINSSRLGLSGEAVRVAQIGFGDGRKNGITIKFVQDSFHLPATASTDPNGSSWTPPSNAPRAVTSRLAQEMPYRELLQALGASALATAITNDPDVGMLQVAAGSPTSDAASAELDVDAGSGYQDITNLDFCPTGTLDDDLTITGTSITLSDADDLEDVVIGSVAYIGAADGSGEYVRVDAVDTTTKVVTIARGCLDTIPQAHTVGDPVIFFDDFWSSDQVQRTAADSVDVKLLTITAKGQLDIDSADADTVAYDSRAIRPLPPADFQIGGVGYGPIVGPTDPVMVTWANRNRLTNTDSVAAWAEADQTPESGQTTTLILYESDGTTEITRIEDLTGTSYSLALSSLGSNTSAIIEAISVRDGYESRTGHRIQVSLFDGTPIGLLLALTREP